ncbi:hypothetical protein EDB81DRAFT_268958 [Dactylonectria macrodidyma]|uniref:Uncharacterized protein n=1 Tax=Dactylonectria macrodidyma TaxID=307937 RepID=A0A9P9FLM5_9HYPO|nr:hypothetical protein EDB81DRAFT_268958 [Dactylonectria macrodidyma]
MDTAVDCFLATLTDEALCGLVGDLDGEQDAVYSKSFHVWYNSHVAYSLFMTASCRQKDSNLWYMGYTLWEYPDTFKVHQWMPANATLRRHQHRSLHVTDSWPAWEMAQSLRQREDIFLAGGSWYWPRGGCDFSRTVGISEETQKSLIQKWEQDVERKLSMHASSIGLDRATKVRRLLDLNSAYLTESEIALNRNTLMLCASCTISLENDPRYPSK